MFASFLVCVEYLCSFEVIVNKSWPLSSAAAEMLRWFWSPFVSTGTETEALLLPWSLDFRSAIAIRNISLERLEYIDEKQHETFNLGTVGKRNAVPLNLDQETRLKERKITDGRCRTECGDDGATRPNATSYFLCHCTCGWQGLVSCSL